MTRKKGLWVYRAYDEYGLPMAEAYDLPRLLLKVEDECGEHFEIGRLEYRIVNPLTSIEKFTVELVFVEGLE